MNFLVHFLGLVWKFRNELAIVFVAMCVCVLGLYVRYVYNDRLELKAEVKTLQAELARVGKQLTLNEEIVDALKKLRVQTTNYVSVVESGKTPVVNSSFVAVPAGVFNPSSVLQPHPFGNSSSSTSGVTYGAPK